MKDKFTTAKYLHSSTKGGTSSVVRGGQSSSRFPGGVQQGVRDAGTKRFDVTNRSLNRGRKM